MNTEHENRPTFDPNKRYSEDEKRAQSEAEAVPATFFVASARNTLVFELLN